MLFRSPRAVPWVSPGVPVFRVFGCSDTPWAVGPATKALWGQCPQYMRGTWQRLMGDIVHWVHQEGVFKPVIAVPVFTQSLVPAVVLCNKRSVHNPWRQPSPIVSHTTVGPLWVSMVLSGQSSERIVVILCVRSLASTQPKGERLPPPAVR